METLVEKKTQELPEWVTLWKNGEDASSELTILGEHIADECYSYDETYVVKLGDRFFIINTSGCSCPSPTETYITVAGPAATLGGLFDELHVKEKDPKCWVREEYKLAFVDALKRLNDETIAATRSALGMASHEQ